MLRQHLSSFIMTVGMALADGLTLPTSASAIILCPAFPMPGNGGESAMIAVANWDANPQTVKITCYDGYGVVRYDPPPLEIPSKGNTMNTGISITGSNVMLSCEIQHSDEVPSSQFRAAIYRREGRGIVERGASIVTKYSLYSMRFQDFGGAIYLTMFIC